MRKFIKLPVLFKGSESQEFEELGIYNNQEDDVIIDTHVDVNEIVLYYQTHEGSTNFVVRGDDVYSAMISVKEFKNQTGL